MVTTDSRRAMKVTRATQYLQSKGYLIGKTAPAKLESILGAFCALDGPAYRKASGSCDSRGREGKWRLLDALIASHGVQTLDGWSPHSGAPTTHGPELEAFIETRLEEREESKRRWEEYQAFLKTREWRAVRYQVLQKHGGRCQCCGRSASDGVVIHVDHIKPRSKFPELALDVNNLQVLCEDCNLGKSNNDATDWRPKLVVNND